MSPHPSARSLPRFPKIRVYEREARLFGSRDISDDSADAEATSELLGKASEKMEDLKNAELQDELLGEYFRHRLK